MSVAPFIRERSSFGDSQSSFAREDSKTNVVDGASEVGLDAGRVVMAYADLRGVIHLYV